MCWLNGDVLVMGMWWLNDGDVVAQTWGCGGSMVVHQAVKPAVPGSNPASLQPAGTCYSLLGSQQGWHGNCRLASEEQKRQKNTKKCKKKRYARQ